MSIVYIVAIFFIFSVNCFAENKEFDGYAWEELGKVQSGEIIKTLIMWGYLNGYAAYTIGYLDSAQTENDILQSNENLVPQNCKNIYKSHKEMILKEAKLKADGALSEIIEFVSGKPGFYVKEIDSFYQTYPTCKSKYLGTLLWELAKVWGKTIDYKVGRIPTYKDVGERCSTSTK